jgi:hypothetical protein
VVNYVRLKNLEIFYVIGVALTAGQRQHTVGAKVPMGYNNAVIGLRQVTIVSNLSTLETGHQPTEIETPRSAILNSSMR